MIGGIFLEIPFGMVYKKDTVSRIRKNINKILGFAPDTLTYGNLDKEIVNEILKTGRRELSKHLSSVRKEYQHRTSDLIRSTVMAVYKDGKFMKDNYYRFDRVQPVKPDTPKSLVKHDWDLVERAESFLREYKPQDQSSRFTAVIAVTAPYAVRLESTGWGATRFGGYNLAVLKYGINRIGGALLAMRPQSATGKAIYGYIFESDKSVHQVKTGF